MSSSTRSPAQNRVSPLGTIIAVAGRGAWMGNRGRLHEGRGTREIVRNHQSRAWITCVLSFKGRRLPQWDPHHYTQLFFLDEAVSFAAGHRPCAECRREDFNAYRDAWAHAHDGVRPYARDMDAQLHAERLSSRAGTRALHPMAWSAVPDGVFVALRQGPAVVVGDHLAAWSEGDNTYGEQLPRPDAGEGLVITPPSTVDVLRAGYPVQIDESAR